MDKYIMKQTEIDDIARYIERSNYEAELKRLKKELQDPLQGKSILYRTFVKIFKPEMMRKG